MLSSRRATLTATTMLLVSTLLAGCGSTTASPVISAGASLGVTPPASTPIGTTPTTATPVPPSPAPTPQSTLATTSPSANPTPISSLDPGLSDAGVVGRLVLVEDVRHDWDGTHDIIGVAADGSDCSYSMAGDEFTAVAWYDDAPDGMIHQMAVSVPTDSMPASDGDQRLGIVDGRVYADFVTEAGSGTAYSGDASEPNNGSVTIAAAMSGKTLTFTFEGTTWDDIPFSGQMICAGPRSE